ncbi:hypothetical protein ACFRAE_00155 [Sphingobacterium sp. HJSM2_6]|uniref:hypothetical protein n=1 Tax=Sphingobacterium sp. HJSM2_6 TaxID=3366264 RepID=UPI003BD13363
MKIEVLHRLTKEELEYLGQDGYESYQIFKLIQASDIDSIMFKLTLENLETKYVKDFGPT